METPEDHSVLCYTQSALLDTLNQAAVIWDMQGVIRLVNKAAETLLGISSCELSGKNINSSFFSLFRPSITFDASLCAAGEIELEYSAPNGDKSPFAFRFSHLPIIPSFQQSCGFIALFRDISKYQLLQKSQIQDRLFIKRVIETSPNIIFIWDIQKKCITFINSAVKDILGFSPEEILEKRFDDWQDIFSYDDQQITLHHINQMRCLKSNDIVEHEYHLRNKQHEWCWLKGRETIFSRAEDGTPKTFIGAVENITQLKLTQKNLEKRLQREELFSELTMYFLNHDPKIYTSRIQSALEKVQKFILPDAIIIYECDGARLIKTYEVKSSGKPAMFPEHLKTDDLQVIKDSLSINQPFLFEPGMEAEANIIDGITNLFDHKITGAGIFPLAYHKTLLGIMILIPHDTTIRLSSFDINVTQTFASILSYVLHNQDLDIKTGLNETKFLKIEKKTKEKQEVTELKESGRDIITSKEIDDGISFEQMNKIHTERLFSIGQLASGVAHQINNPLTTIIAEAQILMQDLGDSHPARASAEAIIEAGWKAQEVVKVLNNISQTGSEQKKTLSINETIENAILLMGEYLKAASVEIKTDFDKDLPLIYGNSRDIINVWVNLLLLAHSSGQAGRINQVKITTRELSPEWIEITFQENGKVFAQVNHDPVEEQKSLPDSYRLVHEFELVICREIINQHEGFIELETSELITNFRVRLPKG